MTGLIVVLMLSHATWPIECGDGWRATKGTRVYDCVNGLWERSIQAEFDLLHRRKGKRGGLRERAK